MEPKQPKTVQLSCRINEEWITILDRESAKIGKELGRKVSTAWMIEAMVDYLEDMDYWNDVADEIRWRVDDEITRRKEKDRERKRRA
jgi:hypothetical protein